MDLVRSLFTRDGVRVSVGVADRVYQVRPDRSQEAAVMLHELYQRLVRVVEYAASREAELAKYATRVGQKIHSVRIMETEKDSMFTSYSINKGDELVFCLRSKTTGEFHDINELMYVAVHEIAHIACPQTGHTQLFRRINRLLLQAAIDAGVYQFVDYSRLSREYCGIQLSVNILSH